jgi:hypothetical protein
MLTMMQPNAVIFAGLAGRARRDGTRSGGGNSLHQNNREALATGTLLLVDNAVDQAASTIRLKASFPNEDEKLWPGDFVNARLLVETRKGVITLPSSAVQRGQQGLFAWIVTAAFFGVHTWSLPYAARPTTPFARCLHTITNQPDPHQGQFTFAVLTKQPC